MTAREALGRLRLAILMLLADQQPRLLGEIGVALGMDPRTLAGMTPDMRRMRFVAGDEHGRWSITPRGLSRVWGSRVDWLPVGVRMRQPARRKVKPAAPRMVVVLPAKPRSWCDV